MLTAQRLQLLYVKFLMRQPFFSISPRDCQKQPALVKQHRRLYHATNTLVFATDIVI